MEWSFKASDPLQARRLRKEFMAILRAYGDRNSDFSGAEMIYGELIGNVARHAPGPLTVDLHWDDVCPVLVVHDVGGAFSPHAALPADPLAESGRGLYIVRTLAKAFRVADVPDAGSEVAVVLPVTRRLGTKRRRDVGELTVG